MQNLYDLDHITIETLNLPIRFKEGLSAACDTIYAIRIPDLLYVVLYGSCAQGNLKTSSDIDLLIVTDKKITDRVMRSFIREKVDSALKGYHVTVDIVFYTEETLFNDCSIFTHNIKTYGKIIKRRDEI